MKDKVMISDWKEIHKFFSDAKQRKVVFYITFGDPSEQAVADFRISEIIFRPQKTTKASGSNVTVQLEALRNQDVKFATIKWDENPTYEPHVVETGKPKDCGLASSDFESLHDAERIM